METKIEYSIKHVGINAGNDANAQVIVQQICALLGISPERDSAEKVFAGTLVEVMKSSNVGTYGHIGLQTPDVELAMKDLAGRGATFRENTIRRDENGKIIFVYLEQEIAGFAFHLIQSNTELKR